MISDVIKAYYIDNEEMRLKSTLARKVEFISTTEAIEPYCKYGLRMADIGCGTGIYSVYFAHKGLRVTSIDIVPKHIDYLSHVISKEDTSTLDVEMYVGNACDLFMCQDKSFDIVLCMGPLYHLTKTEDRNACIDECIRVANDEAIIAFSYISPYSVFPCVVRGDSTRMSIDLIERIINDKRVEANDACCFWTDNYYYEPEQIEALMNSKGLVIVDHLATDGQSIAFQSAINDLNTEEFGLWLTYHRKICRVPAIIGTSNHGLIIAKKR